MQKDTPMPRTAFSRNFGSATVLISLLGSAACDRAPRPETPAARRPSQRVAPPTTRAGAAAAPDAATEKPLYERLGGTAGVTKVVDDFVALAAADPTVNFTRQGHPAAAWDPTPQNLAALKKRLVEFIATTTGGDLTYSGKDMVAAHRGMHITDAEFDALAADLKAALAKHEVRAPEQAELLAIVNRTRSAIVADAAGAPSPAPAAEKPAVSEKPAPVFVPHPVTSDETELEEEPTPTKAAPKNPVPAELNK
jgi:hemoglobin